MYIVEAEVDSSRPEDVRQSDRVYDLVGETDEINSFNRNLGSLVLSALNEGLVSIEDGYALLEQLSDNAFNDIKVRHKEAFHIVTEDAEFLKHKRLNTLMDSASEGVITIAALWEEIEALRRFWPQNSGEGVMWLTKDGLGGLPEEGELKASIYDHDFEDVFGKDSLEVKLAKELELDREAFQFKLMRDSVTGKPSILWHNEISLLGRLDDEGKFEPVVTVLNGDYLSTRVAEA